MQLEEEQLDSLNSLVKSNDYAVLLVVLENLIEHHVDDVDTIEELYLAKGKNYLLSYLKNLEDLVEQANAL